MVIGNQGPEGAEVRLICNYYLYIECMSRHVFFKDLLVYICIFSALHLKIVFCESESLLCGTKL